MDCLVDSRCFSPLPGISVDRRTFEGPPFTARRGLRQRFRHILNFYIPTIEFVLLNPLLLSKGDYAWLVFAVCIAFHALQTCHANTFFLDECA